MTATITELPRYSPRDLATIDILIKAGEVALALGGTGEPIRHRLSYYYRCRCPRSATGQCASPTGSRWAST